MPRYSEATLLARSRLSNGGRAPLSDDLLLRRLLNRSVVIPLDDAMRAKLKAAGITTRRQRPCRCFTRSLSSGYGRLWNGLAHEYTHRISYRVNVGPVPEGHDVLHHCDVTACWEPSHLWTGTHADNMADREAKGRNGGWKLKGRKTGPSHQRGVKHKLSKLTEVQAREIKRREGKEKGTYLAARMGVSPSLVYAVWAGRSWAWLS
jgi:hypothetical protein